MTGSRIKELREDPGRDLTQEQLAYRAGVSVATVRRIESRGGGTSRTLRAIAKALEVTVDDLFPSPEEVAS